MGIRARSFVLLAALSALIVVTFPSSGFAGKPLMVAVDDTYQLPSFCGAAVTVHDAGHFVSSVAGDIETDRYELQTTVTSRSGVVVLLHSAGIVSGNIAPTPNGDGTFTASVMYKGLAEQWRLPGGRVLTRDAGVIAITDTLDAGFNVISEQLGVHGPHPEAASGFGLECQILGPILAG